MTICEYRRINRFDQISENRMSPNASGDMVIATWTKLPGNVPEVILGAFVLMPNHFHGLITFDSVEVEEQASLSDVIHWFKTMTTNWYLQGVRSYHWPRYDQQLWQRSFHDRIVRTDAEMDRIRTYVENNPVLWARDTFFEP